MIISKKLRNFSEAFLFSMRNFSFVMRYTVRKVVILLDTKQKNARLEQAVERYGNSILRLAFTYLKNRFDAEDAAQDVFLTYHLKAPRFSSEQKERSWLMAVTANRCKSMLRDIRRREVELPEDLSYLPEYESDLIQAMLELDEKYRIALHLHYYEGYSLAEIGRMLHCSVSTVGSRLTRGREKLKMRLGEDYFED